MTKNLSMVSHKFFNLSANECFVIFLIFKLITCFIDNFTLKMKSHYVAYLLNESEHIYIYIYIGFWTLKVKCIQYGLYGQAAFKNARAILFFKVGWGGQ